jgi:N-glycosylase/DNA lyase
MALVSTALSASSLEPTAFAAIWAAVMDYRLTNKGGTWYAYDVIVDGVSLVMNYRSQFGKIIGESSFQELLRRLRERKVSEEKAKT